MRAIVEGLPSPHPIRDRLPALYQGQDFTTRFCSAFDEVLAPVIASLDNLPAYLDVRTAPEDMLPWLAHWVGVVMDPGVAPDRQRELLQTAATAHGWQGTARGIELAVEALLRVPATVVETGGTSWSQDPAAALPGESLPATVVQVHPAPGQSVDLARLEAIVRAVKPAHVMHRVMVTET